MCIDIVEVWFRIATGQILSILTVISLKQDGGGVFLLHVFVTSSKLPFFSSSEQKLNVSYCDHPLSVVIRINN